MNLSMVLWHHHQFEMFTCQHLSVSEAERKKGLCQLDTSNLSFFLSWTFNIVTRGHDSGTHTNTTQCNKHLCSLWSSSSSSSSPRHSNTISLQPLFHYYLRPAWAKPTMSRPDLSAASYDAEIPHSSADGSAELNELPFMGLLDSSCSERSQRVKSAKANAKRKTRACPSKSTGALIATSATSTSATSSARHKSAIHRIRKRDAFKRIDCKLLENEDRIRKLEEEIDNVLARFSTWGTTAVWIVIIILIIWGWDKKKGNKHCNWWRLWKRRRTCWGRDTSEGCQPFLCGDWLYLL